MERENDIIHFDNQDKKRCSGLPAWVPIEAAADIFQNITEQQATVAAQIQELNGCDTYDMNYAELSELKKDATDRYHGLQLVLGDLVELAGAEIIEMDLPLTM